MAERDTLKINVFGFPIDSHFLLPFPFIYPGATRWCTVCLCYTACVQMRSAAPVDHLLHFSSHANTKQGRCKGRWMCPRDAHQCVYLSSVLEEVSRRLIKHPCELEAWERVLKCRFQPGAWNKRSREQRPLTGVGTLTKRERAGDGNALQCRTPLALGTQRPPTPVKGGIAHATG